MVNKELISELDLTKEAEIEKNVLVLEKYVVWKKKEINFLQ